MHYPSPNESVDFRCRLSVQHFFTRLPPHPSPYCSREVFLPTPNMISRARLNLRLSPIALSLACSRKLIAGRGHARCELHREGVHTSVPHEDDDRHELTSHAKSHHLLRLLGIAIVEGMYARAEEVGRDEASYRHEGFGLELFRR